MTVLVQAQAFNRATRALEGVRFSSRVADEPDGIPYAAAILDATSTASCFENGLPAAIALRDAASLSLSGPLVPSEWLDLLFRGHPAEIRSGTPPWSTAQTTQKGTWDGEGMDASLIRLNVKSTLAKALEQPVDLRTYQGTGGVEGGLSLAGVVVPRPYGYVRNVTPVLVDPGDNLYQASDAGVVQIVPREGARVIDPMQVEIDIDNGRFRTLFSPGLQITCDVVGPTTNPVTIIAGLLGSAGVAIDSESFTIATDEASTYGVGEYLLEPTTLGTLIERLVRSIVLDYGVATLVEEAGVVSIRRLGARPSPTFGLGRSGRLSYSSEPGVVRLGSVRVNYGRNWTEMDDASLSGARAAEPAIAAFASRPFATLEPSDPLVEIEAPGQSPVILDTSLDSEEGARALATAWMRAFRRPWTTLSYSGGALPNMRPSDHAYVETAANGSVEAVVMSVNRSLVSGFGQVSLAVPSPPTFLVDENGDYLVDESHDFLADDI